MVAAAAVPNLRCPLGCRVMAHGKDYFTDKAPMTTLAQLDDARSQAAATGMKYAVYYSERLHSECSMYAGNLIGEGAIGRVLQVIGMGPHRLEPRRARRGSSTSSSTAESSATSAVTRSSSSCISPAPRTPRSRPAEWRTTTIPHTPNSRTSATSPSWPTTGRRTISGWTGSPRTGWAPGATAGRSFSDGRLHGTAQVPRRGAGQRVGQLFLVDGKGEHHIRSAARWAFRSSGS